MEERRENDYRNQGQVYFSGVGMVKEGNRIWFASREINGLFQMDSDGKNLEYIGSFPDEQEDCTYLYGEGILYEENIIFAPYNAEKIGIYNIREKKFEEKSYQGAAKGNKYIKAVKWKSHIILLPAHTENDTVVKIHMPTGKVKYIEGWKKQFQCSPESEYLLRDYCIAGDCLYAPVVAAKGQIMKYHLETDEIECFLMPQEEMYKGICYNGEVIYLCSQNGTTLMKWNIQSGKIEKKLLYTQENIEINTAVCKNNHIFLFSNNKADADTDDMIFGYDIETEACFVLVQTKRDKEHDLLTTTAMSSMFAIMEEVKTDRLFALNSGNGNLYEIDTKNMCVKEYLVEKMDARIVYQQKFMQKQNRGSRFIEKAAIPKELELFIESQSSVHKEKTKNSCCGTEIWNKVKA